MDEITRRAWLLRLGELTVLTGFAGVEAGATPPSPKASELPPGLYEPSLDHLAHMRVLESRGQIPPGAETDFVTPQVGPYQPQFFSADEFETVTRLVRMLLGEPAPKPETIAEVAQWIDLRVGRSAAVRKAALALSPAHRTLAIHFDGRSSIRELETTDLEAVCRSGLAAFEDQSEAQQRERLTAMSEARTPFFELLKGETIRGYYTSREGLAELDYKGNSFYAVCPGCDTPGPG
jgi:hypothetical protein